MDKKAVNTDKILNESDADQFLRKIGLTVGKNVVCKVLDVLTGESSTSIYELYTSNPRRDGTIRIPTCGKGTADKIKKLFKNGELQPYIQYLEEVLRRSEESKQFTDQPATASAVANVMAPSMIPSAPSVGNTLPVFQQKVENIEQDAQLIKQQQKEHIKWLQQMARSALDHLPDLPDLQNEPEAFDSFNDAVVKVYRRLTRDVDWKGMAEHLGDQGNKIEMRSSVLDDILPGGSLVRPKLDEYRKDLEEAWFLIKTGGLKTISESSDTRKWEWEGLNQRCQNCPDQEYEPVDITPEDI